MFDIQRINTTDDFRQLREEWNELLENSSSDCLFLSWEWMFTWWKYLSEDKQLHVITVRNDRKLIAIAPLVLRPRRLMRLLPFRVLEFVGTGSVGSDYLNVLIRQGYEQDALRIMAGCLTEHGLVLEFSQVERTSSNMIGLVLQLRQLGWDPDRTTINFCPYIQLGQKSWDTYLAGLGRSHRYNFRRRLRNLERSFDVRFKRAETEEERHAALQVLTSLHLERWSTRGGSDAFHKPELLDFHEEMTSIALQKNWLRLYVLYLDNRPAAAIYGFIYNNIFYFYQSGFDPAYGRYSTGMVIMGLAIKSALEEGADEYDLLHGHEDYKYLWANKERELVRLDVFPPFLHGSLCRQAMQFRWGIKRLVWRRLPPSVSEWLAPGRRLEMYWNALRSGGRYVTRTD